MNHNISQPALWVAPTTEEEDLDEPPEPMLHKPTQFRRTPVRRNTDQSSLLTQAFKHRDEDDAHEAHEAHEPHETPRSILANDRRRSMASNISVASTADLTSDTGLTSPSRTNTPSPPIPEMAMLRLTGQVQANKDGFPFTAAVVPNDISASQEAPKESAPRKRCIQFACAAKPIPQQQQQQQQEQEQEQAPTGSTPMVKAPSAQDRSRKPCIRFACPPRPASTQNTPPRMAPPPPEIAVEPSSPTSKRAESPSTPKKTSALSAAAATSPSRPQTVRRLSNKAAPSRPKFLRANSKDLARDSSQFHEFASGVSREDDWIRDKPTSCDKLTINDTLTKENDFRRLANEAEEEAAMEEDDDEDEEDDEYDEDDEEEDEDEDEEEDDEYDDSDGYYTDEETGFADSDESDEEDENMVLWTPSHAADIPNSTATVVPKRRYSVQDQLSDSSLASKQSRGSIHRVKPRRILTVDDEHTHDLPDSTDFVCGTLDEDRPLEEAYLSCLAARRNEKLRIIPQDIDPSFPTSDPENEEQERYNPVHHESDEENPWVQGKMEDLHHGDDRSRRRRKSEQVSPRRYHSPPPRRVHSPAPTRKTRGRSPKPLFGRQSPRRARSPAPRAMTTPTQSPRQGANTNFHLAGRPDVMHTKSLPRPAAMFRMKSGRIPKRQEDDIHVRGAVDIVKGLERKRQRRKEKFYQKYCNRARRGQIPERKPQPGMGAERMKELGLLMAGKKDPGNYVLSV